MKGKNALFQSIQEVFDRFDQNKEQIHFGLERMEWMLERLGHPERRLKFIHIAGTNGKGSTAVMIASVLQEAGYVTGLFTSPYLSSCYEQIRVGEQSISEKSFLHWVNHLWPFIEQMEKEGYSAPSQYELWTLVAICYFAYEVNPWFVVWETGLGGRLDATNIVHPIVSVITQIGIDHKDYLGDSLIEIAKEKAAIIKPGVPVVCSAKKREAVDIVKKQASSQNSPIYVLGEDYQVNVYPDQQFDFSNVFRTIRNLKVQLRGRHQLENAATAMMTLEVLRQQYAIVIEDFQLRKGFLSAFWPGRFEQITSQPITLLDGAHNVDSIKALKTAVQETYTYERFILLTAMMRDKEVEEMLQLLLPLADEVVVTEVQKKQFRSMTAQELSAAIRRLNSEIEVHAYPSVQEGLDFARSIQKRNDLLLVTGSLYLISEVRSLLS